MERDYFTSPSREELMAIEQEEDTQDGQDLPDIADSVRSYLAEIGAYKIMTPEEELATARLAVQGDTAAVQKLTTTNLKLVVSIAKKYIYTGMDILDLIQNGNLGLIKAVDKFDPELGFKFSTYATWWIRQSILRGCSDQSRLIRLPVHAADSLSKINKAKAVLLADGIECPTPQEIADVTGFSEARVAMLLQADNNVVSIDLAIGEESDTAYSDLIPNDEDGPQSLMDKTAMKEDIDRLLRTLPERECYVIKKRFGMDGDPPQTLEEVAVTLGVTRERVRQIEAKAFRRLRNPKNSRALIPYLEDCN